MARIVYGVAGEGFGHSSRCHLIGQRLLEAGHDVIFACSNKSLEYLKPYFGQRVKEIHGLTFDYEKGYVDAFGTIKKNIRAFPKGHKVNVELFKKEIKPFKPELILTDFEPFSAWWAWRNKVPYISIDNEHVLTHCRLEHKLKNINYRINSFFVTKFYYAGASSYLVMNFFKAPMKSKDAVLAPPVIRPVVCQLKSRQEEHIVVYFTTAKDKKPLAELLNKFPQRTFHIYGYDVEQKTGNCIFKKRSTEGFLNDLAGCKAVIATAGFSLISECMYLRKKMLLLPVKGQYEQIINAYYIEKLGLGTFSNELSESALERFCRDIEKPILENNEIIWPDNEKFFDVLSVELKKINPAIKI
jgi:uncharacterized protein (TIGR00661 family)